MFSGPFGVALLQPTSSDVKSPPGFTAATIWSIEGADALLFSTGAPVVAAAEPPGCGDAFEIKRFSPLTTVSQFFTFERGASSSLSVQSEPVEVGFQRGGKMPLPKNHVQYRRGRGVPCANAVPLLFSIASKIGSGMATAVPVARAPRRTARRFNRLLGMFAFLRQGAGGATYRKPSLVTRSSINCFKLWPVAWKRAARSVTIGASDATSTCPVP